MGSHSIGHRPSRVPAWTLVEARSYSQLRASQTIRWSSDSRRQADSHNSSALKPQGGLIGPDGNRLYGIHEPKIAVSSNVAAAGRSKSWSTRIERRKDRINLAFADAEPTTQCGSVLINCEFRDQLSPPRIIGTVAGEARKIAVDVAPTNGTTYDEMFAAPAVMLMRCGQSPMR